jgi:hypothetical protein
MRDSRWRRDSRSARARCPADLDASLAERGYRWDSPMSLEMASTMDIQAQAHPSGPGVRLNETPTTAWFEVWDAVHGHGSDPQNEWEMLGLVTHPSAYASATEADRLHQRPGIHPESRCR